MPRRLLRQAPSSPSGPWGVCRGSTGGEVYLLKAIRSAEANGMGDRCRGSELSVRRSQRAAKAREISHLFPHLCAMPCLSLEAEPTMWPLAEAGSDGAAPRWTSSAPGVYLTTVVSPAADVP